MPLTPADVHNVAFSKPPIGKRGYNEDEVDAFLDLVETELGRLVEDNADLRQRVSEQSAYDAQIAAAQAVTDLLDGVTVTTPAEEIFDFPTPPITTPV